ncbi:serine/threonine protein kinase [Pendulispora rubella]|uniref:non-specific serine/threonine protein kinase n=1 Tax=Pendulispora rubella TaxID=2741070 RepID=A0ABZ2KRY0_9BACT
MHQDPRVPDPAGAAQVESFAPGDIVAERYRLERIVGEGGMGIVWAATHLITGRAVAIKVLKRNGPEDAARLLREARVAASLQHRNIIQVFDLWQLPNTGVLFMVMDLLRGESLAERLHRERVLSVAASAEILHAVASALKSAHAQGFVHRDLKPDNIFLAQENDGLTVVKVLDFGLARPMDPEMSPHVTSSGAVTGTPHYMAPEQVFGEKKLDRAVDVWALGVVWVECLSGRMLFDGENFGQIFRKIALGEHAPLEALLAGFAPELVALIARMLARDPSKRPTDDEVLSAFRHHQATGSRMGAMETSIRIAPPPAAMETAVARSFSPSPLPTVQHTNLVTSVADRKTSSSAKPIAVAAAALTLLLLVGASLAVRSWLSSRTDAARPPAAMSASGRAEPSVVAEPPPPLTPLVEVPTTTRDAVDAGAPAPHPAKARPAKGNPNSDSKDYLDKRF